MASSAIVNLIQTGCAVLGDESRLCYLRRQIGCAMVVEFRFGILNGFRSWFFPSAFLVDVAVGLV